MYTNALLHGTHAKEKSTTDISSKPSKKKYQKRPRIRKDTQESDESECPQLKLCKLRKGLTTSKDPSSKVPTLPAALVIPVESAKPSNSLTHIADPTLAEALVETLLLNQLEVTTGLMNLSQVDFDFLKDITISSLNFDVYNVNGKEWEEFQSKQNHTDGFFTPIMPDKENFEGSIDLE
ncbi:hypothetical protein PVK06_008317 [Gossypium arboreum]|uniref:Uncharacterized protein n=1 Tax=Gossypium arboreum TaxID=29729 RepID=A0ABR0QJV2_GOSAR|nr:hypothetical protein PVK06_008317 [Gossypium arboreum]